MCACILDPIVHWGLRSALPRYIVLKTVQTMNTSRKLAEVAMSPLKIYPCNHCFVGSTTSIATNKDVCISIMLGVAPPVSYFRNSSCTSPEEQSMCQVCKNSRNTSTSRLPWPSLSNNLNNRLSSVVQRWDLSFTLCPSFCSSVICRSFVLLVCRMKRVIFSFLLSVYA